MSSLQEQLQKDRACRQVRLQRDSLEREAKFWHKCFEDKQKEADSSKRLCLEQARWAKRQVDDNREVAKEACADKFKAEDREAWWRGECERLRFELTRVPQPSVLRDDLLPAAPAVQEEPQSYNEPLPSQKPLSAATRKDSQKERNKERRAKQRENKRQGEQEREARKQWGAVGGFS